MPRPKRLGLASDSWCSPWLIAHRGSTLVWRPAVQTGGHILRLDSRCEQYPESRAGDGRGGIPASSCEDERGNPRRAQRKSAAPPRERPATPPGSFRTVAEILIRRFSPFRALV